MNKRPSEVQVHHSGRGELTLAALIAEARTRAEKGLEEARKRHERADLYYNNVQPNENNTASDDDIVDPPRRHGLRNLLRTVISRMVEARQFPKVWPAKAEPRAIMAAEAANALLKHQRHRVGFDLWSVDVVRTAYLGGKVGVVPLWDETAGEPIWAPKLVKVGDVEVKELDEDGNEIQELLGYEGEVQWQMLLPHEYSYWPIPRDRDLRRCRSLMVRSFVDIHEAGALLGDEADQDFDRVPESDMVEAVEMWYVPCSRIPMGMHSLVVGGRVAIHEDWNLPFRRIPLAEFGIDPVAGTQYFTSPFHDAIDIQRMINDKEAAKFATVRRTGYPVLLGKNDLADRIYSAGRGGPGRVSVPDHTDVTQGSRWMLPPEPHPLVFNTQGEDVSAMFDVMGVSEVSSGMESAKAGQSAKGIAYMDHLDAQKMSPDVRALERFQQDLFWLTLELYRDSSGEERRVRVLGADGQVKDYAFLKADLDGYDLSYEPTDGKVEMQASVAADATTSMQQTGPVPELLERASTGLGQSSGTVEQRIKLADQAQRAMRGEEVHADRAIPPQVALVTLRVFQGDEAVDALIAEYEQLATSQAAAGESGPATPGPKPGAPQ